MAPRRVSAAGVARKCRARVESIHGYARHCFSRSLDPSVLSPMYAVIRLVEHFRAPRRAPSRRFSTTAKPSSASACASPRADEKCAHRRSGLGAGIHVLMIGYFLADETSWLLEETEYRSR